MIVERLPEVQHLSNEEKLILASELWHAAADATPATPEPAMAELLRERLAKYHEAPEAVSSWEDVKRRILDGNAA